MDLYRFFGFLVILKESIKLFCKNGKLMVLVTTISLVLSSIFFLIFDFSSFSLMRDMLAKESIFPISSSNSAEFASQLSSIKKNNAPQVLSVYVGFVLSYFIVTFLPTVAVILVSAESYISKTLSLKELSLSILKSWTRPFVTGFYTTIFVSGYVFFVISLATPLLVPSNIFSTLGDAVLFGIVAYIFYLYISSVWILGLVVSVVDEEKICGIEALGRSAAIVKGQKINGFLLNIVFNLVSLALYLGSNMVTGQKCWISDEKISGLVLVNGSCLVRIFTFMAYTVLYVRGKESGGQEIELQWSNNIEYSKLATTLDVDSTV